MIPEMKAIWSRITSLRRLSHVNHKFIHSSTLAKVRSVHSVVCHNVGVRFSVCELLSISLTLPGALQHQQ
jgi:hypothetical protein